MIETEMIQMLFVAGEWIESSTSGETFDVMCLDVKYVSLGGVTRE
jgi:hypothetical protein